MLGSLRNKALGLAGCIAATALLMGACPGTDILNNGQQPAAQDTVGPTIAFAQPTARVDVATGDQIAIQWTDSHPAGAATIQLFYDRDGVAGTGDEITIAMLTETAATTTGGYAWNTTGLVPNIYRLGATISDQVNPPVTRYLDYEIVIRAAAGPQPSQEGLSLDMQTPATSMQPQVGQSVLISWKATDPSSSAHLYLYYDTDLDPTNDNKTLIATVGPGTNEVGSNDYGWTIPDGLFGSFHILGRLTNGVDPDVFAYAPGTVQIGAGMSFDRDLSKVGVNFAGAIFNGYVPHGRLGDVMTGGRDWNRDTYSDFLLVAPKALSQGTYGRYNEGGVTGVGEAYLIFSSGISGRWPQGKAISVGNITSYALEGIRFIGPAFSATTSGFSDAMFIDDVDGDNQPELLFGFSDLNAVMIDDQDYDPLDSDAIHDPAQNPSTGGTNRAESPAKGRYYFHAPGWKEYSDSDNGHIDDLVGGEMRSGLVTWISSKSAINDTTVYVDDVGGVDILALPQTGKGIGMKIFPDAGGDNNTGWGAKLGTSKLLGDLSPCVLIARPHQATGAAAPEAGSVKVMPHNNMHTVTDNWAGGIGNVTVFNVQPKCFTFPYADSDAAPTDPDRVPRWPFPWSWFMDPVVVDRTALDWHLVLQPPDPLHFDIVNDTNVADATNGHLTNPTGLQDFDGDKIEDAAVASPGSNNDTGITYVVYGNPSWFGADLGQFATVTGSASGFELRGTQQGEKLGFKMVGPGNLTEDVNAGLSDWVMSAPMRSWAGRANCGAIVIVPGQRPRLLGSKTVDQVVTDLGGAIIYGANPNDQFGTYLCAAGDVDRDGYQDLLIAAPNYTDLIRSRAHCGAVYLIYGGPQLRGELDIRHIGDENLPGKVYIGPAANALVGPVSKAGDVDNDYYDDFLIAQPNASPNGLTEAGQVWLVYGGRRTAP